MPIPFNLDALDDELIPDGTPSFNGGQVSNERANLIKATESVQLINCDIDKFGKIRTRRGSSRLGSGVAGTGTYVQGLTFFKTKDYNYIVAANNGKIYKWVSPSWTQIATGGVFDNDAITFIRLGAINNAAGYDIGAVTFVVDGFVGKVHDGETFYILDFIKTQGYFAFKVASHTETGGNTTGITIAQPGLPFKIFDNYRLAVLQPAAINNVAGYAGGATVIAIDGYVDAVNNGEKFIINDENVVHTVSAHTETGGHTTEVTFSPGIQGEFVAGDTTVPIIFTQGVDKLFWTAGGSIYGWDGKHTLNLSNESLLDTLTVPEGVDGKPPSLIGTITWFQNRLIASKISGEPDTVYFSDFLDPAQWSKEFQSTRIGGGESDPITGLVPWTDLNLVVFKERSVYIVNCDPSQNPDPSDPTQLVSSFSIKVLNKKVGCRAPFTAVQVGGGSAEIGGDIFFLADDGVRSIRRTIAAETQQDIGEPISYPIHDIIERINPAKIHLSVATYHNNRYILAVPLDGATQPDTVLAFNVLTQSWMGTWTGWLPTSFAVDLVTATTRRLCFGQSTGTVFAWLDDTPTRSETNDTYKDEGVDIPTLIQTRSYTAGDLFCPKTGLKSEIEYDESEATVMVQTILDTNPASDQESYSTVTGQIVVLPVFLPFNLGLKGILRKSHDLMRFGQWRELRQLISSSAKKLQIRSIRIACWFDSMVIQE